MQKHFNIAVYLSMFILFCDQASKWWVIHHVMPGQVVPVNPVFNLVLVENRGITFGLLGKFDPHVTFYFLTVTAGIVLFLLGRWLWLTTSPLISFALSLIMGGAVGNVIDRFRFTVVVDFLDFHLADHHWYAFNLADSAIVTGVSVLLLESFLRKH